jgi:ubiquitin carboxyl-terminal hydrolase L5
MGVKDVEVTEIFDFASLALPPATPCYGLVFLFQWTKVRDERPVTDPADLPHLFFAHQTVQNACATQAVLSVLLNSTDAVDLGEFLTEFRSFTLELPADIRGEAIGESDRIRAAHNSFDPPDALDLKADRQGGRGGRAYHYVAYVPVGGRVYELDGLKPGPIDVGAVPSDGEWTALAADAIQSRIARFPQASELEFSLMSLNKSSLTVAREAIVAAEAAGDARGAAAARSEVAALEQAAQRAKETNARRGHNYLPFIVELMRVLEREGRLDALLAAAEPASAKRAEKKRTEQAQKQLMAMFQGAGASGGGGAGGGMEQLMALMYWNQQHGKSNKK